MKAIRSVQKSSAVIINIGVQAKPNIPGSRFNIGHAKVAIQFYAECIYNFLFFARIM
jgi:hypothetical protein